VQGVKFSGWPAFERCQGKAQVGVDIEITGLVIGIELVVFGCKVSTVNKASLADKLTPQVITVAGD